MNITIDKNLRDLRGKRGNTQEDLAAHLSISPQAVSRWERGETMPDITFLPAIAAFYDVTVDELLGVGEIRKQEKIHEYRVKSFELARDGLTDKCIDMWREAYSEFPNDMAVNEGLMYALYGERDGKFQDEALELGERILRESTDEGQRSSAIQILCFIYSAKGNKEKAKEYANMANSILTSKEALLLQVLDGEDGKQNCMQLMLDCLGIIEGAETRLSEKCDDERSLQLHEFYLKMLGLFFDDGFYGVYAIYAKQRHSSLARIYLTHRKDEQKAYEHLKEAVRFAKQYDSLPDSSSSIVYTSTLLNGYKNKMAIFGTYSETECELLLKSLGGAEFDTVREKSWFKEIEQELTANIAK